MTHSHLLEACSESNVTTQSVDISSGYYDHMRAVGVITIFHGKIWVRGKWLNWSTEVGCRRTIDSRVVYWVIQNITELPILRVFLPEPLHVASSVQLIEQTSWYTHSFIDFLLIHPLSRSLWWRRRLVWSSAPRHITNINSFQDSGIYCRTVDWVSWSGSVGDVLWCIIELLSTLCFYDHIRPIRSKIHWIYTSSGRSGNFSYGRNSVAIWISADELSRDSWEEDFERDKCQDQDKEQDRTSMREFSR